MDVKNLLLKNHQLLGDTLMMTAGVRDLKSYAPSYKIWVDTNYREVWENNPHIEHCPVSADCESYNVGPRTVTQSSATNGLHFANAYRVCIEEKLGIKIRQGPLRGEIFLNEEEKKKIIPAEDYWVINIDCGPYDSKRWSNERWQEVVDLLPWITFVQIGLDGDNKYRLRGRNVIDFVGKTQGRGGLRRLFGLVYNAHGCFSLVSSLAHIAGAFDKSCVTVAGAREPITFEQYQQHRYLSTIGSVDCARKKACWRCKLNACKKQSGGLVDGIPKCLALITAKDVANAAESYYRGEALKRDLDKPIPKRKKIFRVVSNARMVGGAERSAIEIIKMAQLRDYRVELAPRKGVVCPDFRKRIKDVYITDRVSDPCDVLLFYSSDMVFDFHKNEFSVFEKLEAKRKVMALTYKIGKAGETEWTKGWDEYLFLCSDLEKKFLNKYKEANTKVLAPPVNFEDLLKTEPNYQGKPKILRHSSQGDSKFSKDINELIKGSEAYFSFMPAPSFLEKSTKTITYGYNEMSIKAFLQKGNCFWYLLPEKYTDQGPRVIVEAMASGLPVIAENRDGAKDRVTTETGWLINNHREAVEIINSLTPEVLEKKGKAARERAKTEFRKERWIEEILGD